MLHLARQFILLETRHLLFYLFEGGPIDNQDELRGLG